MSLVNCCLITTMITGVIVATVITATPPHAPPTTAWLEQLSLGCGASLSSPPPPHTLPPVEYSPPVKRVKKMSDACASDLKIVIDVGYEDLMTDHVRPQTIVRKSMYMIAP